MVDILTSSDLNILLKKGYKVDGLLGEGIFSTVYAVSTYKNPITHERLACKYVNKYRVSTGFSRKFFPRELQVLLCLNHPNIIQYYKIIINNNKYFILMKLAEGGDLLTYLRDFGSLKEELARFWFHQLAQAIFYIHSMDIVHRDIKLENILISSNYNLKLSDFGFTRIFTSDSSLSETFCGSKQYVAPEVLKGLPYNPKQSDVWSLGCILFAMLNKKLPFNEINSAKMYEYQMKHKIKYRENVLAELSHEVKSVIYHMLEPNTEFRYSIQDVVQCQWLRVLQMTDAQRCAIESVTTDKKLLIRRNPDLDMIVSTLQYDGDIKFMALNKINTLQTFESKMELSKKHLNGDNLRKRRRDSRKWSKYADK